MPDEPVSVVCPNCRVRMKLKDASALGKTIKCPKCGEPFVAQTPAAVGAAAGAPVKKKRPPTDAAPMDDEDEDAPDDEPRAKKKKKRKKGKKSSGAPLPLILGISAFVFLLVVGGVVIAVIASRGGGSGSRAAAVAAPDPESGLAKYQGPVFSILGPKDWKPEVGGEQNHQYVVFEMDPIKIRAQDDSAGFGDVMSGANRGVKMPDYHDETIHHIHLGKKESIAGDFGDYKEDEPVPFDAPLPGMGRYSEFSGTTGTVLKAKVRGIRATVQSNTKTIIIRCICPEKQWDAWKPVFEKIVKNIGPGMRL